MSGEASRGTHTSSQFEAEVRDLRGLVIAMGGRCVEVLDRALATFLAADGDAGRLAEIEALDKRIDQDEIDIDERVLRVLALRQPVAFDLRFLTAALKLATDLERIGDEAVNVAERATEVQGAARAACANEVRALGEGARGMLKDTIAAFEAGDEALARKVCDSDEAIDTRYHALTEAMLELVSTHPEAVRGAIAAMKVAKYLERVADHATNVAEEVIFIVTAQDVRRARRA
jgi:phosphate transport system protein